MRALLRSEPFCGWGLKLAFFTEWSWLAYQRLESAPAEQQQASGAGGSTSVRLVRRSRTGKPLHPLYPVAVCDFAGVDGKRIPLVTVPAQHMIDAGVADQPVKKRATKKKADTDSNDPPQWPEVLPRSANLKGLDACIQDFDAFPIPQPSLANTDLTRKMKRVTKASKEAAAAAGDEEEDLEADDEDATADSAHAVLSSVSGSSSTRVMQRMRFDDLNTEESEWKRFERAISTHLHSLAAEPGSAMSEFMQTCVQRHIAAQDKRTLDSTPPAPTIPCALCREPVDLTRQLDFAVCPRPYHSALPTISGVSATSTLHKVETEDGSCTSIFHLSCLADSFLQQQQSYSLVGDDTHGAISTVLPTHGTCPSHTPYAATGEAKTGASVEGEVEVALWADVVRGMYRRHERFERLVEFLARSGRTLAEHLNPPESVAPPASPTKGSKTRANTKAAADDPTANGEEKSDVLASPKKAKATGGRKKRQAATSIAEETTDDTAVTQDTIGQVTTQTKRKAPRKARVTAVSSDVIDLT